MSDQQQQQQHGIQPDGPAPRRRGTVYRGYWEPARNEAMIVVKEPGGATFDLTQLAAMDAAAPLPVSPLNERSEPLRPVNARYAGWGWGYKGAGPRNVALALLADALAEEQEPGAVDARATVASLLMHAFVDAAIARLGSWGGPDQTPQGWMLSLESVVLWTLRQLDDVRTTTALLVNRTEFERQRHGWLQSPPLGWAHTFGVTGLTVGSDDEAIARASLAAAARRPVWLRQAGGASHGTFEYDAETLRVTQASAATVRQPGDDGVPGLN